MFAALGLLWPVCLLLLAGEEQRADAKVTAFKIVETRMAEFEKKQDAERMWFSFESPGLTLTVALRGPSIVGASQWGFLKFESAKDDQGRDVKLDQERFSFADPREEFLTLDRDAMSYGGSEPAKDELRIEWPLTLTPRDAKSLSLSGQFKLKVVEPRDVLATEKDAEGHVKHPILEQAGLKLTIKPVVTSEEDIAFVFEVSGPIDRVLDVFLLNAAGEPLETRGRQRVSSDDEAEYTIWLAEAPPADAQLKLSVAVKETTLAMPFELKDVQLP